MLQIKNVSIIKGQTTIFQDLNLNFQLGKSYSLIGYSGSGKSTLLNCIAGFERLNSGEILFSNKKLITNRNFYKSTLGYLFQNYGLIDNATIDANLDIGLAYKRYPKKQKLKLKTKLLEEMQVHAELSRKISTLSGGEQLRIALIRLLLKQPSIILADEPTGSVDKDNSNLIIDKLLNALDEKKIIIIATHDLAIAQKCDECIRIEDLK
ncbi:ATP-binding cassette domain-containing protein [Staphylococcus caeli]|uniref:ABC transporter ATP-binding protein n=1 Tax=Staphylococcus caeli TaxID=2201815 RepID=A0A1D4JAQ0_9STAP|nr:ATP-binding cassette domain-containing protein [Staphylococcus caeli]SCS40335.1 ABC transporter ATP-binding protein [Staphylococcus caeli]SCS58698.1 ABC transporter ATP-binding protein [Staphylococcus caeli]